MARATRSVAVVMAVLLLGVIFVPDFFGSTPDSPDIFIFAAKLVHLLSFATAWGVAVWALFIGGAIMFITLPRHVFGNLRSKVFPVYFMVMSVSLAVSVMAFAYLHPWRSASAVERYQLGYLLVSFALILSSLLVFAPKTIEIMKKRHKIERDLSIGEEVGWWKNIRVAKTDSNLAAMNKKFEMIHGLAILVNMFSFVNLAIHSWYIAGKINM